MDKKATPFCYTLKVDNLSFAKHLIKGRIAETIFHLIFAEVGEFTITPFGYERTIPALSQFQHEVAVRHVLDVVRKSPDFILVSQNKAQVFFVEVKYRTDRLKVETLKTAQEITEKWSPVWLFLASPAGFFFDSCKNIIQAGGEIAALQDTWVSPDVQKKYHALLNECLCLHSPTLN